MPFLSPNQHKTEVNKKNTDTNHEQEGLAVASKRKIIPPLFPAMIPSLAPAFTATAMRGKLESEFET